MPRRTKPMTARCRVPQQIDLFAGEPRTTIGVVPAWSGLPTEVQAALTDLMTRLILEHADKSRIGSMSRRPAMIYNKVRPHHLERKALLSVRRSSRLIRFCTTVRAARCSMPCAIV